MSTVTNPYTFNIKSNCGFSTGTLASYNQVKITMKYSYSEKLESIEDPDFPENPELWPTYNYTVETLDYQNSQNIGSMVPNIVDGNTITHLYCKNQYGDIDDCYCILYIKSDKKYSKVILNGGIFKNCALPIKYSSLNGFYIDSNNDEISKIDWSALSEYNNVPFDLTIKFVE